MIYKALPSGKAMANYHWPWKRIIWFSHTRAKYSMVIFSSPVQLNTHTAIQPCSFFKTIHYQEPILSCPSLALENFSSWKRSRVDNSSKYVGYMCLARLLRRRFSLNKSRSRVKNIWFVFRARKSFTSGCLGTAWRQAHWEHRLPTG